VCICENLTHCHNSMLKHNTHTQNETTQVSLRPLSADAASELYVLRVDGHTLSVNRAEVSIFEQTGEISLGGSLTG